MGTEGIKVLLVEDNPSDAAIVRELLEVATRRGASSFSVTIQGTLKDAKARLASEDFDLALLDLTLPDSDGLQTLKEFGRDEDLPVLILTGIENEKMALEAIQFGAQDYLVKNGLTGELLVRSIRFGLERHRLLSRLANHAQQMLLQQEVKELTDSLSTPNLRGTAHLYGERPLKEVDPEHFKELVSLYVQLLDLALERRMYVGKSGLSEHAPSLGQILANYRASPGDLIDIHRQAITDLTPKVSMGKRQVYLEEGRLVLLEVMGYLAFIYRRYYFSGSAEENTTSEPGARN